MHGFRHPRRSALIHRTFKRMIRKALFLIPILSFSSAAMAANEVDDCFGVAARKARELVRERIATKEYIEVLSIHSPEGLITTTSQYGDLKGMIVVGKIDSGLNGQRTKKFEIFFRMNAACAFLPGGTISIK